MGFWRSFNIQLFTSHVLVSVLTVMLLFVGIGYLLSQAFTIEEYRHRAMLDVLEWQFDHPGFVETFGFNPDGFAIVTSATGEVLDVFGNSDCELAEPIEACHSDLAQLPIGSQFIDIDGQQIAEIVLKTKTGERVYSRREPFVTTLNFGSFNIAGFLPSVLIPGMMSGLVALPLALIISILVVRPQVRRISRLAKVSQSFANGDLSIRVQDPKQDELGRLGQQFDSMAGAIQRDMTALSELAERNAALAQQVEAITVIEERNRLARELHDSVTQTLFSLTLTADTARLLFERDPDKVPTQLVRLKGMANEALSEMRTLIEELHPAENHGETVSDLIQRHIQAIKDRHGLHIDYQVQGEEQALLRPNNHRLYRVVQEAINNIVKHAQADQATVKLRYTENEVQLDIEDKGQGFELDQISAQSTHIGLWSMQERVQKMNGTMQIKSHIGAGTRIHVRVPMNEGEAFHV